MKVGFVIAVAIVLGLLLFLIREVRRPHSRKILRVTLDATILTLALLLFWGFLIEPNRLIERRETIRIDNWPQPLNGLKIAVLSDIHVDGWAIDEKRLRTIVERVNQLQPDLVVIPGDYISNEGWVTHHVAPEVFAPHLKEFKATFGVYSVLGNHDWWHNGDQVRRALEQNGVKVLEDEVAEVNIRGTSLWLAGLSDLWTRPQKINETIDKVPQGVPLIGLTHNPDIFPQLPQRVSLLLAGHTHGGQVKFPLIGSVVHSSKFGERYSRGHFVENNHHLYVTSGIGTSILPVRFGVPPEIVLLTLNAP